MKTEIAYNSTNILQHAGRTYLAKDSKIHVMPRGTLETNQIGRAHSNSITDFNGIKPKKIVGVSTEYFGEAERAIMLYDLRKFENILETRGTEPKVGNCLAILLDATEAEKVGEFGYVTKALEAIE